MSIELDSTFREEGEEIFSLAGKHRRISDFGFLLVAIFVTENRLIVVFMFQSIVLVPQRLAIAIEGFQCLFVIVGAGFKKGFEGAEASEEVMLTTGSSRSC